MTQKDFIESIFFDTKGEHEPIQISKDYHIPQSSTRRVIGGLFREGKLEQKIIRSNKSIYRWKNESI